MNCHKYIVLKIQDMSTAEFVHSVIGVGYEDNEW